MPRQKANEMMDTETLSLSDSAGMHAEIRLCNLFDGALISCGIVFLHQHPVINEAYDRVP